MPRGGERPDLAEVPASIVPMRNQRQTRRMRAAAPRRWLSDRHRRDCGGPTPGYAEPVPGPPGPTTPLRNRQSGHARRPRGTAVITLSRPVRERGAGGDRAARRIGDPDARSAGRRGSTYGSCGWWPPPATSTGSTLNWWLGRFALRFADRRWFPVSSVGPRTGARLVPSMGPALAAVLVAARAWATRSRWPPGSCAYRSCPSSSWSPSPRAGAMPPCWAPARAGHRQLVLSPPAAGSVTASPAGSSSCRFEAVELGLLRRRELLGQQIVLFIRILHQVEELAHRPPQARVRARSACSADRAACARTWPPRPGRTCRRRRCRAPEQFAAYWPRRASD